MSSPPSSLTASSTVVLLSVRRTALCICTGGLGCPASLTALTVISSASVTSGSCDANKTLPTRQQKIIHCFSPHHFRTSSRSAGLVLSAQLRDDAGRCDSTGQAAAVDDNELAIDVVRGI